MKNKGLNEKIDALELIKIYWTKMIIGIPENNIIKFTHCSFRTIYCSFQIINISFCQYSEQKKLGKQINRKMSSLNFQVDEGCH